MKYIWLARITYIVSYFSSLINGNLKQVMQSSLLQNLCTCAQSLALPGSSSMSRGWKLPPIRTVPKGEAQLEWPPQSRDELVEYDVVQFPLLNLTHSLLWRCPPQASSPVCEWYNIPCGRSGNVHQGLPSSWRSSTDVKPADSLLSSHVIFAPSFLPPVTMIQVARMYDTYDSQSQWQCGEWKAGKRPNTKYSKYTYSLHQFSIRRTVDII